MTWTGKPEDNNHKNDRLYQVDIEGKPIINGSADKPFFGDSAKYNPEDMLLAALSSCHMMSFLYVCRKKGLKVLAYSDKPNGELLVNIDGSGQFEKVGLHPTVVFENELSQKEELALHVEAGRLCFIANSCNFEIVYEPR